MFRKFALVAFCAAFSTSAFAHDFKVGGVEIDHPLAFETPPMAMTGGGFVTITNTGDSADRLIAARADFPRVEIHETVVTDGVGQMLPVDGIDIPAGETVTLQPGGYHVMFIGLDGEQFVEGEKIPATLVFEQAGEVAVEFSVEKRPSGTGMNMDHDNMNMEDDKAGMEGMSGN